MNESTQTLEKPPEFSRQAIFDTVKAKFGVDLKEDQYKALDTLVNRGKDLILSAKTGFGKSLVFQALPLLYASPRTAIILMPLNALEHEQCERMAKIPMCKPFVLNADSKSPAALKRIREGEYTHCKMTQVVSIFLPRAEHLSVQYSQALKSQYHRSSGRTCCATPAFFQNYAFLPLMNCML